MPPESSTKPLLASANDALSTALELGIVLDVHVTPPFWLVTIAPRLPHAKAKLAFAARRPVSCLPRLEPTWVQVLPPSVEVNIAPLDAPATACVALAKAAALIGVLPNDTNAPVVPPLSVRTRPVLFSGTSRHRVVFAQRILRKLYGPPAPVTGTLVHVAPASVVFSTVEFAPAAKPLLLSRNTTEFNAAPPVCTLVQLPAPLVVRKIEPPTRATPLVAEVKAMSVAVAPPPAAWVPGTGAELPEKVAPASLVTSTCPVLAST